MPQFSKLTPNLLVANVERSLSFYVDVLGFERGMTVPEQSPFVFAAVARGAIEIFFNHAAAAVQEEPAVGGKSVRRTRNMVIRLEGCVNLHAPFQRHKPR